MLFIVGYHGSGKSTVAEHLRANHGYVHLERSAVLTRLKGLEDTEKPMGVWREEQKRQLGKYALEDMIIDEARTKHTHTIQRGERGDIVITGNRSLDEVRYTASSLTDIDKSKPQIIALTSDITSLFERFVRRARSANDSHMSIEGFMEMYQRENKAGIEELIANADHTISNNGSRLSLLQSIDRLLGSIQG